MKTRLKQEGNELATICSQLKLKSPKDGKMYKTDVADMQGIFRIIQSVPSKKAEPFKMWLAENEITDKKESTLDMISKFKESIESKNNSIESKQERENER